MLQLISKMTHQQLKWFAQFLALFQNLRNHHLWQSSKRQEFANVKELHVVRDASHWLKQIQSSVANDQASQRKVNQNKRALNASCRAYWKLASASTGKAASAAVVTSFTTLSTPFAMLVVIVVIMLDMMHLKLWLFPIRFHNHSQQRISWHQLLKSDW